MVLSGSASVSAESFYRYFQSETQEIQQSIAVLSDATADTVSRKSVADTCLARITRLAAEVADAAGDIPSYDQRSYNETIKSLQDKLAQTQATHAPKAKFSFKSKRNATTTPPIASNGQRAIPDHVVSSLGLQIDSVSSSRSVTPVHLQTPDRERRTGNTPVPIDPLPAFHTEDRIEPTTEQDRSIYDREPNSAPSNTISDRDHRIIVSDLPTSVSMCTITNLSSVSLRLASRAPLASLTLTSCSSSLLTILTPIAGPSHITGLQHCVLLLHTRQFRMHDCDDVDVYLFASSRPIIENCRGIRFHRLPDVVAEIAGDETMGSGAGRNMFDQVDDFKWLRAEKSPNWRVAEEGDELAEDVWKDVLTNTKDDGVGVEDVLRKVRLKES